MAGWVPMNADWWPSIAEAMPKPWSRDAAAMDLRWHADQVRVRANSMPSRRQLMKRWGWSDHKTRILMKDEGCWKDPANGEISQQSPTHLPTSSQSPPTNLPAVSQQSPSSGTKTQGEPSAASQQSPSDLPRISQPSPNLLPIVSQQSPQARLYTEHPTQTQPQEGNATGDGAAIPAALSSRVWKALKAVDLGSPQACAALTRSELLKRNGIGEKAANAVVLWLAAEGLSLRPEVRRSNPMGDPQVRACGDAWQRQWQARHPSKWAFDWAKDARKLRAYLQAAGGSVEAVEQAFGAYLDAEAEGRGVWPHDKAPGLHKAGMGGDGFRAWLNHRPRRVAGEYRGPSGKPRRKQMTPEERAEAMEALRRRTRNGGSSNG